MTPVLQRSFEDHRGDCFAACLASLLDVPLDAVPNFRALQTDGKISCSGQAADDWLRENHHKRFIDIEFHHGDGPIEVDTSRVVLNRLYVRNRDDYVLLSGESPRKNADGSKKYHCVVGRAKCWGFEVVHDPHPDGGGIVGQPYGVKWIVQL